MEDSGRTQQVRRILWARGLGLPAPKRNDWHMAWHANVFPNALSFGLAECRHTPLPCLQGHTATLQAGMGCQQKASLLATAAAV